MPGSRHLYADLAAAVARSLPWSPRLGDHSPGVGAAGELFFHEYMSAFEIAVDALDRLSVIEPVDETGDPTDRETPFRRLRLDVDAIAAHVLTPGPDEPSFDDLLSAFIRVCDQRGLMPVKADLAFVPPEPYRRLIQALADAGHAETADELVAWTGRSAQLLHHAYFPPRGA